MNETVGSIIARLRKEKGMTQEQLAGELGISYQAVSKWENELSSPDISALPLLADLFGVSIDALFGREGKLPVPVTPAMEQPGEEPVSGWLPWADDDTLHAVLFVGHRLLGHDGGGERLFSRKQLSFCYEGPALNVQSDFSVTVEGDVQGSVSAGGDVTCKAVGGPVSAGGSVDCGDVTGDVNCGGDLDCGTVAGNVLAGGDVDCGSVGGNASAGGDLDCGSIHGRSEAGGGEDPPFRSNLGRKKGFSFELKL